MMFKALGLMSLMLQNPAEALYWYQQELDSLRELRPTGKYYREFAQCVERTGEALLMYGYLDAAECFCERSIQLRRAAVKYVEKTACSSDYRDYFDLGFLAYDEYRIALLTDDSRRMRYACRLLKEYRDEAPFMDEEKKEEVTEHIRRIEEIALKISETWGDSL